MQGLLISDFNIENFASYLRCDTDDPIIECEVAPFGQITQILLDSDAVRWKSELDFVVVWSRPEAVLESIAQVLAGADIHIDAILKDVDAYCGRLLRARERTRIMFIPTWTLPTYHLGHGLTDLAPNIGVARCLMDANCRLLQNLDGNANVVALHAQKWIELAGNKAFSPRLWYLGKVPFGNEVFKAASRDLKAAVRGMQGRARKLLILDLDNTLWDGVVGDDGWENLTLGGHSPVGEALADFQREVKALNQRGVTLAIASKNDELIAIEAIRKHPEMILAIDDFATWRINWTDKARNIASIVAELNIGLDATVFIDDSPVERARVQEALPQVLVPDWPEDKKLYPYALRALNCFDKPRVSDEDRDRQRMYLAERTRNELKNQVGSIDEWLRSLGLVVIVESLDGANIERVTQLLNKTNQMNLSTRRLHEDEVKRWAGAGTRQVLAFKVSDKFGDAGLTGILGLEVISHQAHIVDFVLSCRVMGRKIEETMIHVAVDWARSMNAVVLQLLFSPTTKNRPCLQFLQNSGLQCEGGNLFSWDLALQYPLPEAIRLVRRNS